MITTAYVKIWGETAGAVAWDDARGVAAFEYDPAFQRLNWELSPLKMPLGSAENIFTFPELRKANDADSDTFRGLPGLLADVLPDRYGNQLIDAWLSRSGRAPQSMNPVEMLCFIGSRGMGALEFEPMNLAANKNTFAIELDSLVNMARKMLSEKNKFAANMERAEEHALSELLKIGTSAGGARPKAVVAYDEKSGEIRSGQTKAPKGFEHWIIKLDGVSDVQLGASKGYGRVEMAYYLMATACGLDMMPSRLIEENNRAHFMTKRFDREDGDVRHHIQTWCAIKHYDFNHVLSYSYEQLFQTMRELHLSYPEAEQVYRRMVFNVLAKNCDDHTKNFSFRLKQNDKWELAPAYDICHAYKPNHRWVSQHALSVNGKRQNIQKADFLAVAKAMNIKGAEHIINETRHVIGNWKKFADEAMVSKALSKSIADTLFT